VQHNPHHEQAQTFCDFKKHVKLHCQSLINVNAFDFMHNLSVPNMTNNAGVDKTKNNSGASIFFFANTG
jgi:hypothetical protein